MKDFSVPWSGRSNISGGLRKAAAVVTMIAALFVVAGMSSLPQTAFAADYATIHFYPSPACVGVGDTLYLKMYGWGWNTVGTKWKSDNSGIAAASGKGLVTGMSVGTTNLRLKDGFGQTIKTVNVTVKQDMADCASFYMPGVDLTPPQYEADSDSFSFVFVSDTQGCSGCSAAGGPDLVDHDFAEAFANRIVTDPPAFVAHGGDMAGLGGLNTSYERQWLDDISMVWRPDQYGIPIYAAVGNHDLYRLALGASWKTKQSDWQNNLWPEYFADGGKAWPTNQSSAYRNLTYSFSWGNSIFIFTDMLYMWGSTGNDQDWQGNMMIQEINPEQIAYVKYMLRWAKDNGKQHAFIFGHPPYLSSGSTTAKGNNNYMISSTLLSAYGLTGAYMGGHTNELTHRTLGNGYQQFTAETGGGDSNPNSYLRVDVAGSNYSVQANFLAHGSSQWYTTTDTTWDF